MKATVKWQQAMAFTGTVDNHSVAIDTKPPLGENSGPSPKQLVVLGLGGCTAMDVVAFLKKFKQVPEYFAIEMEVNQTSRDYPIVFESAELIYVVKGAVDAANLLDAVSLSQTKYCGVSAMLAKAFPIRYRVVLNGEEIGTGQAFSAKA